MEYLVFNNVNCDQANYEECRLCEDFSEKETQCGTYED